MIGIFDSGSGGLTVLRAIREQFPSIDVIYYGDIKNSPYGTRPQAELALLTIKALQFLSERGARSIVSACNSVSASLALSFLDTLDTAPEHLIEMVGPTVRYFRGTEARIALCATPATIASGIYQNGFAMIGKPIHAIPITDLAGTIEFGKPQEDTERIIRDAFPPSVQESFDILILACTHYPLVIDAFKNVLGEKAVFDPALAISERVYDTLWPREMGDGKTHFVITAESQQFRNLVQTMFPESPYEIEVLEN